MRTDCVDHREPQCQLFRLQEVSIRMRTNSTLVILEFLSTTLIANFHPAGLP